MVFFNTKKSFSVWPAGKSNMEGEQHEKDTEKDIEKEKEKEKEKEEREEKMNRKWVSPRPQPKSQKRALNLSEHGIGKRIVLHSPTESRESLTGSSSYPSSSSAIITSPNTLSASLSPPTSTSTTQSLEHLGGHSFLTFEDIKKKKKQRRPKDQRLSVQSIQFENQQQQVPNKPISQEGPWNFGKKREEAQSEERKFLSPEKGEARERLLKGSQARKLREQKENSEQQNEGESEKREETVEKEKGEIEEEVEAQDPKREIQKEEEKEEKEERKEENEGEKEEIEEEIEEEKEMQEEKKEKEGEADLQGSVEREKKEEKEEGEKEEKEENVEKEEREEKEDEQEKHETEEDEEDENKEEKEEGEKEGTQESERDTIVEGDEGKDQEKEEDQNERETQEKKIEEIEVKNEEEEGEKNEEDEEEKKEEEEEYYLQTKRKRGVVALSRSCGDRTSVFRKEKKKEIEEGEEEREEKEEEEGKGVETERGEEGEGGGEEKGEESKTREREEREEKGNSCSPPPRFTRRIGMEQIVESKSVVSLAGKDIPKVVPKEFLDTFKSLIMCEDILKLILEDYQTSNEVLVKHLYRASLKCGFEWILIKASAKYEITRTEERALLFRMDSVATKLFRIFNQSQCSVYLENLLVPFFQNQEQKISDVDLSLESDDPSPAQSAITNAFGELMERFVELLPQIPSEMIEMCTLVSKMVAKKFGKKGSRAFLVGYFFLRFIAPSLMAPQKFLKSASRGLKKLCVMQSKLLQTAASGQKFETERMTFANESLSNANVSVNTILSHLGQEDFSDIPLELKEDSQEEEEGAKTKDEEEEEEEDCSKVVNDKGNDEGEGSEEEKRVDDDEEVDVCSDSQQSEGGVKTTPLLKGEKASLLDEPEPKVEDDDAQLPQSDPKPIDKDFWQAITYLASYLNSESEHTIKSLESNSVAMGIINSVQVLCQELSGELESYLQSLFPEEERIEGEHKNEEKKQGRLKNTLMRAISPTKRNASPTRKIQNLKNRLSGRDRNSTRTSQSPSRSTKSSRALPSFSKEKTDQHVDPNSPPSPGDAADPTDRSPSPNLCQPQTQKFSTIGAWSPSSTSKKSPNQNEKFSPLSSFRVLEAGPQSQKRGSLYQLRERPSQRSLTPPNQRSQDPAKTDASSEDQDDARPRRKLSRSGGVPIPRMQEQSPPTYLPLSSPSSLRNEDISERDLSKSTSPLEIPSPSSPMGKDQKRKSQDSHKGRGITQRGEQSFQKSSSFSTLPVPSTVIPVGLPATSREPRKRKKREKIPGRSLPTSPNKEVENGEREIEKREWRKSFKGSGSEIGLGQREASLCTFPNQVSSECWSSPPSNPDQMVLERTQSEDSDYLVEKPAEKEKEQEKEREKEKGSRLSGIVKKGALLKDKRKKRELEEKEFIPAIIIPNEPKQLSYSLSGHQKEILALHLVFQSVIPSPEQMEVLSQQILAAAEEEVAQQLIESAITSWFRNTCDHFRIGIGDSPHPLSETSLNNWLFKIGEEKSWRFTSVQIRKLTHFFLLDSVCPSNEAIGVIYQSLGSKGKNFSLISRNMLTLWFQGMRSEFLLQGFVEGSGGFLQIILGFNSEWVRLEIEKMRGDSA